MLHNCMVVIRPIFLSLFLFYSYTVYPVFNEYRALAAYSAGDHDHAYKAMHDHCVQKPFDCRSTYNQGVMAYGSADYANAYELFKRCAQNGYQVMESWFNAGNASMMEQDFSSAIDCYDHVLSCEPGHEQAIKNKEIAQKMLEQQNQEQQQDQKQEGNDQEKSDDKTEQDSGQKQDGQKDSASDDGSNNAQGEQNEQKEQGNNKSADQEKDQLENQGNQSNNESNQGSNKQQESSKDHEQDSQKKASDQASEHEKKPSTAQQNKDTAKKDTAQVLDQEQQRVCQLLDALDAQGNRQLLAQQVQQENNKAGALHDW